MCITFHHNLETSDHDIRGPAGYSRCADSGHGWLATFRASVRFNLNLAPLKGRFDTKDWLKTTKYVSNLRNDIVAFRNACSAAHKREVWSQPFLRIVVCLPRMLSFGRLRVSLLTQDFFYRHPSKMGN